ncbi:MAG: serine--tRNA ligase, partial [Ferruginibacter sp.]
MLQISYIRLNPEMVKEKLAVKHFKQMDLIDELIELDDNLRKYKRTEEEIFSKINSISKEIGQLMAKGDKELAEEKKKDVTDLKAAIIPGKLETETRIQEILYAIPNLPHVSVPKGKTPEENEVVREGGSKPALPATAVPHWELIKTYDLVDFETGAKITGSGFPLYKGKGARLQRALIQYFLDYNTAAGYTEYLPPLLVNEASAYGTGQLPDKEGQMYHA